MKSREEKPTYWQPSSHQRANRQKAGFHRRRRGRRHTSANSADIQTWWGGPTVSSSSSSTCRLCICLITADDSAFSFASSHLLTDPGLVVQQVTGPLWPPIEQHQAINHEKQQRADNPGNQTAELPRWNAHVWLSSPLCSWCSPVAHRGMLRDLAGVRPYKGAAPVSSRASPFTPKRRHVTKVRPCVAGTVSQHTQFISSLILNLKSRSTIHLWLNYVSGALSFEL